MWKWVVRCYDGDRFMIETVHKTDWSKDLEVDVALQIGWTSEIFTWEAAGKPKPR